MISVAILTKNNEDTIEKVLCSVEDFDEVILIDTGSKDKTIEIAKKHSHVNLHFMPFLGFGKLRNHAATLAKNDWILALDSDEVLSDNLKKELLSMHFDPQYTYSIPFYNFYNNRHIKACGWYPEYHLRLYNKKHSSFNEAQVHEKLVSKNHKKQKLLHPIYHYSYRNTGDFLKKMHLYSSLYAKEYQGKKKSSFKKALGHAFFAFFKSYFIKRGIFYGKEGFIISLYNANTAFYKYLKLAEANHAVDISLPSSS